MQILIARKVYIGSPDVYAMLEDDDGYLEVFGYSTDKNPGGNVKKAEAILREIREKRIRSLLDWWETCADEETKFNTSYYSTTYEHH